MQLESLPTPCLLDVSAYLSLSELWSLLRACRALLLPSLLAVRLRRSAPHIPTPELARARCTPDDAPVAARAARARELGAACAAAAASAHGTPSSDMLISWGGTPAYWQQARPEAASPYRRVAALRTVCWLDVSGTVALAPGAWTAVMRVCSSGVWASQLRMGLAPGGGVGGGGEGSGSGVGGGEGSGSGGGGDEGSGSGSGGGSSCGGVARFITLEQPPAAAGGIGGPGLDARSMPRPPAGRWLWLRLGRANVRPRAGGDAGGGSSATAEPQQPPPASRRVGWGRAMREQQAAAGDPGTRVSFHVWDHSAAWKSGLMVDRLEWIPEARWGEWAGAALGAGADAFAERGWAEEAS